MSSLHKGKCAYCEREDVWLYEEEQCLPCRKIASLERRIAALERNAQ